jgi:hypothetical protein
MSEPDGRLVLTCPACGRRHDCQKMVSVPRSRPRPGDISVCIDCGALSVLSPTMELRRLTDVERFERLLANPTQWELAEQASRLVRARGGA